MQSAASYGYEKISGSTFYFKKLFPTMWFGFICIFVIVVTLFGAASESIMFLITPAFMAVFGFVLFRKLVWDLADEVYDEGDSLLFRKGGIEQRVYFKNVLNINHVQMNSPERIVLQLRSGGPIGKDLAFNPPIRLNPLSKSPLVVD